MADGDDRRAAALTRKRLAAALGLAALLAAASAPAAEIAGLALVGEATLPSGLIFDKTTVGGLSGITYDAGRDRFYAVSDDPSGKSPARFYTLRLELDSDGLHGVEVEGVTLLRHRSGRLFAKLVMDAEAIALTPTGTLLISSEGNVDAGVPPSLREFGLGGRQLRELRLPKRYRSRRGRPAGVRHNKAFEALAWDPTRNGFYLATENAIHQDGPAADVGHGSTVRILRYDYRSGKVVAEHAYRVEPVARAPTEARAFRTNGLVELLALGGGELLALERSYTQGGGHTVRLFHISTRGATDVRGLKRLTAKNATAITPVTKHLLLDLDELGIPLDNLEGITFGPPLADGRRSLVLISDDNFNSAQKTQVLALAVRGDRGRSETRAADPQTTDP